MNEDTFQITIPSNACTDVFEKNSPANFKTVIANPRNLEGEWEMAVGFIQYPHSWNNIEKDEYIGMLIRIKQITKDVTIDMPQAIHFIKRQMDETIQAYEDLAPSVKAKIVNDEFYKNGESVGMIVEVPKGYYATPAELISCINDGIDLAFGKFQEDRAQVQFKLEYEKMTRLLKFEWKNVDRVQFIVPNKRIREMLGIPDNHTRFTPDHPPRKRAVISNFSSIFIYSDIARYQLVGDIQAPLLAVVPVKGEDGTQQDWTFNPPYYIPVNKRSIETIEIKLANEFGEEIPFLPGGLAIIRLNFRRKRPSW